MVSGTVCQSIHASENIYFWPYMLKKSKIWKCEGVL